MIKPKRFTLVQFDKYLDKELYLRPKIKRQVILDTYKRYLKQNKSISELEECLDSLGYDEITIDNISKYICSYDYRKKIDKKLLDIK